MIANLEERIADAYEKERRLSPVHVNRASQLGHPCERHLVYWRLDWDKATPPDVNTLYIWEGGRAIEKVALSRFEKAGLTIIHQQKDFYDEHTHISGHIDGMLVDPDNPKKLYPIEIKGLNQFDYERIHSAQDMLASPKPWVQAYPAQLQLYLYLSNSEEGLFYIVNKTTLQGKAIWMELDYGYCEQLLQKAERINEYVANKEYPERIPYDERICGHCPFIHLCAPPVIRDVEMLDDDAVIALLERREEIKEETTPLLKELEEINKKLRMKFEGKDLVIVGDWAISGKWVERKEYVVPAKRIWHMKIERLSEMSDDE